MLPHQVPDSLRARIIELESSVEGRFARHRGVVPGSRSTTTRSGGSCRESDDTAERREAWEASKTVGAAVADDVRELARLRNEAARTLGHRDWFALSLATDELDEGKLLETLAAADRATAAPFARWKSDLDARLAERFGCSVSEIRPWHYADPFFQEPPAEGAVDLDPLFKGKDVVALARRTFEGIGLEVEAVVDRSDLYPRAGQEPARVLHRRRPQRRRARARERDRQPFVDRDDAPRARPRGVRPRVRRRAWPGFCATRTSSPRRPSALLFGGLGGDREWLERVLGVDEARGGGAREPAPRREGRRAPGLHALGARDERASSARSTPIPTPIWTRSGGSSSARHQLRDASGRPEGAGLGGEDPHRRRARLLPHVSLRLDRRACSSVTRSDPARAGSSTGRRQARSSSRSSSRRGSRSGGTGSSRRRRASRSRSSRSPPRSPPTEPAERLLRLREPPRSRTVRDETSEAFAVPGDDPVHRVERPVRHDVRAPGRRAE